MPLKLTEKGLQSLATKDGPRRDLLVAARRGLILRLEPTGNGTRRVFRYRWKHEGRQQVLRLGEYPELSIAEVHALHGDCEQAKKSGGDPRQVVEKYWRARVPAEPVTGPTVADVIDEFVKVATRTRKRPEVARYLLDTNVRPFIGRRPAASITRRDLVELFDRIVERGAPVVANRVSSTLKQAFSVAADRDLIQAVPPFPRARPGGKEEKRTRVLSDAEVVELWTGLDRLSTPPRPGMKRTKVNRALVLALKLQLVTAQRRGELAAARWDDIREYQVTRTQDGKQVREVRHLWRIPETKNGRPHTVPLSPLACALLDELRTLTGETPFLFPSLTDGTEPKDRERSITRVARKVRDELPVKEWSPHDLRRTARTGFARLRVPEAVAERVINHAPKDPMVAVYDQHDYLDEARDALDKWGAELTRITGAKA